MPPKQKQASSPAKVADAFEPPIVYDHGEP
jgi:hypothetical protein